MIDTTELRKAAKAATPGPWWQEDGAPRCVYANVKNGRPNGEGLLTVTYYGTVRPNDIHDARFIALANPATILALLDEREKLLKVVDAAKESCRVNFTGAFVAIRDALNELEK